MTIEEGKLKLATRQKIPENLELFTNFENKTGIKRELTEISSHIIYQIKEKFKIFPVKLIKLLYCYNKLVRVKEKKSHR